MLMFVFLIGTFLVNSLFSLVLFDSGVSRSFLYQFFCRDSDMILGELEYPFQVSIDIKHKVSTSSIFRDGTLKIFWGILPD